MQTELRRKSAHLESKQTRIFRGQSHKNFGDRNVIFLGNFRKLKENTFILLIYDVFVFLFVNNCIFFSGVSFLLWFFVMFSLFLFLPFLLLFLLFPLLSIFLRFLLPFRPWRTSWIRSSFPLFAVFLATSTQRRRGIWFTFRWIRVGRITSFSSFRFFILLDTFFYF